MLHVVGIFKRRSADLSDKQAAKMQKTSQSP